MNQETIKILRDLAVELAQMSNRIYEIGTGDGMAAEGLEPPKDAPARPEPKFKVGDAFVDTLDPKRIFIITEPPRWTGKDGWRYRGMDSLNGDDHWIERMLCNSRIRLPIPARPDQHAARLTGEVRLPRKGEWFVVPSGEISQADRDWCNEFCSSFSYGGRRWICKPPEEKPGPAPTDDYFATANCDVCLATFKYHKAFTNMPSCPLCRTKADVRKVPPVAAPATYTCPKETWDAMVKLRDVCAEFVKSGCPMQVRSHQAIVGAILAKLEVVKGESNAKTDD